MSPAQTTRPIAASYVPRIAGARVYDVAIESPLDFAPRLSARLDNTVLLKREDLQPVFSFKVRGAYNKIAQAPRAAIERGVICASAGNHAQGVALAARKHGIAATIVMPKTASAIKVEAVAALGGEVVLEGLTYDDANRYAHELATRTGREFVHPFDDPDVIAGQGTIALELERQWGEPPAAIFVPVGGGGLIAGIGAYVKHRYPDVRSVGDETFRIAREVVDEVVLVSTDEICAAIKDIFEDSRVVMEPAGALGVAGLKRWLEQNPVRGKTLIAINSGANSSFGRLRHVSERAEIGEHREALIAVEIPERRGAFLAFCEALGARNVTEFNYRYAAGATARIFVGVSLVRGEEEARELLATLARHGYPVLDLSGNEVAKLHVRHMVGGRAPGLADEHLYRFEFPERPGALLAFLKAIGQRWNISLFHYRNHGSDYGRVLAGVQVPADERADFASHLAKLGYAYWEETDNAAYRLFLGA